MRVLCLFSEVMGYTMATLRAIASQGAELHVVHWDKGKLTPFVLEAFEGCRFYSRSTLTRARLIELVEEIDPQLVAVSGWMDKDYMAAARVLMRRGAPVVCALDGQWYGTARQRVLALLAAAGLLRRYFSHAWVAGAMQFEYARRLGFAKKDIVFDLYSADLGLFNDVYASARPRKAARYPRRFLFVGRLEKVKSLDILAQAWRSLGDRRGGWELTLVGNGSLKASLAGVEGLVVKDFMQPPALRQELAEAGCFVLPSRLEPWGVVLHEASAAGLPLLCSEACGSAAAFLVRGHNGFDFKAGDAQSLRVALQRIIALDDDALFRMGEASHLLAQRITPGTSAANLLSIPLPERVPA